MSSPLEAVAAELETGKTDFGPVKVPAALARIPQELRFSERKPVSLLLLGEVHGSVQCALKNVNTLTEFLGPKPIPTLFASEGRSPNPCSMVVKGSRSVQFLMEYDDAVYPPDELTLTLLLDHELLKVISEGQSVKDPSGTTVGIPFFTAHLKEGQGPFLEEAGLLNEWKGVIAAAFKKDAAGFDAQSKTFFTGLVDAFEKVQSGRPNPRIPPLLEPLREYASTFSEKAYTALRDIANETRDVDFAAKILKRVQDSPDIRKVVVIMGDLHFARLKSIFSAISYVRLDERSKSYLPQHAARRKTTRRQRRRRTTRRTRFLR